MCRYISASGRSVRLFLFFGLPLRFTLDLIPELIGIYIVVIYVVYESAHYYFELNIFSIAFNNHSVSVFLATARYRSRHQINS